MAKAGSHAASTPGSGGSDRFAESGSTRDVIAGAIPGSNSSSNPGGGSRQGYDESYRDVVTNDRHDGHDGHDGRDGHDGHDGRNGVDGQVNVTMPAPRGDQVRWGPVWAGLTIVLPVFLLGELLFLALGVLDTGDSVSGATTGVVTGLIALAAFFVGGLVAGATAMWRGVDTGLLHGILVWALGITVILALTIIGGGALLGSAGNIASQLVDPAAVTGAASGAADQASTVSAADAAAAGRSAASWGLLGLGVTVIASALGGLVGAKVWPRKKDLKTATMSR